MGQFSSVARVQGEEPCPSWQDIMEMAGEDQHQAIGLAARHVWLWMRAQMVRNPTGHQVVWLVSPANGKSTASYVPVPDSVTGWSWDGRATEAFLALWPSLDGRINRPQAQMSGDEGFIFYGKVLSWLRATRNAVCLNPGTLHIREIPSSERRSPTWFVAKEWDPAVPEHLTGIKNATSVTPSRAESKLTPEEAGETREPDKVSIMYSCRYCTGRTFTQESHRDSHEKHFHGNVISPVKAEPVTDDSIAPDDSGNDSGASPGAGSSKTACRVCGKNFTTSGNRAVHEKKSHPAEVMSLMPFGCPVEGCDERTDTMRGLKYHLSGTAHSLAPRSVTSLTNKVLAGTYRNAPAHENIVPVPPEREASVEVKAAATPADLGSMSLIKGIEELVRENAELKARLAEQSSASTDAVKKHLGKASELAAKLAEELASISEEF